MTALLVSPVTAQHDKFGDIKCTKLTVVDGWRTDEKTVVDGWRVWIYGTDGKPKAALSGTVYGEYTWVRGKDGELKMSLLNELEHGGIVTVVDKDGNVKTLD